jgi:tripartite-type tricarboxylate transporter receptor subunit TctC
VTAPVRVAGLKDVPSVIEHGFPGLVVEDYVGFAVKSGTPGDVVISLINAINKALQKSKVVETFAKLGATPAPRERARSDRRRRWAKIPNTEVKRHC